MQVQLVAKPGVFRLLLLQTLLPCIRAAPSSHILLCARCSSCYCTTVALSVICVNGSKQRRPAWSSIPLCAAFRVFPLAVLLYLEN